MAKNKNLRRAWIFFGIAMISIFFYFSRSENRGRSTIDEFALMLTGAALAFGFMSFTKVLREKGQTEKSEEKI